MGNKRGPIEIKMDILRAMEKGSHTTEKIHKDARMSHITFYKYVNLLIEKEFAEVRPIRTSDRMRGQRQYYSHFDITVKGIEILNDYDKLLTKLGGD